MAFAAKHNKTGVIFDINIKEFPYMSLYKVDEEKTYKVNGMYIKSDGQHGPYPIIISDGILIGLPEHLIDEVKAILNDPEDIATIKAGKVGFKVRKYQDKSGTERKSIDWVDM